jgi:hypothetical protein
MKIHVKCHNTLNRTKSKVSVFRAQREKQLYPGEIKMIVTKNGKYFVKSEEGKNLGGPYNSREAAVKRLQQVEYFKHAKKKDGGVVKENFFDRINKLVRGDKID